jgi:hypothetical protein
MSTVSVGFTFFSNGPCVGSGFGLTEVGDPEYGYESRIAKEMFPSTEKIKKYVLYLDVLFICDTDVANYRIVSVTINTCYYY